MAHGIRARLLQRVLLFYRTTVNNYGRFKAIDCLDRRQAPILDFKDQHATLRVKNDKIRMEPARAGGTLYQQR